MPVTTSMTHFTHKESFKSLDKTKKIQFFLKDMLSSQWGQQHFFTETEQQMLLRQDPAQLLVRKQMGTWPLPVPDASSRCQHYP